MPFTEVSGEQRTTFPGSSLPRPLSQGQTGSGGAARLSRSLSPPGSQRRAPPLPGSRLGRRFAPLAAQPSPAQRRRSSRGSPLLAAGGGADSRSALRRAAPRPAKLLSPLTHPNPSTEREKLSPTAAAAAPR